MNLTFYIKGSLADIKTRIIDILPESRLRVNRKFHNIHRGQECFILGSGHSILTQDLTRLNGKIVMTQNHFHSHPDIGAIAPLYHVIVPKYQPKDHDGNWNAWFETMEQRLPGNTVFFMGDNTEYLIENRPLLKDRTYYVKPGYDALFMNRGKIDLTRRIMKVPTVITQCITIALYMGFDRIYLTGFDLDQLCRIQDDRDKVRFYGNSQITDTKAERKYEEDLASSGVDWFNMWAIWKQLNMLKRLAEKQGTEIINITNGGLLNIYRRDSYDKILG